MKYTSLNVKEFLGGWVASNRPGVGNEMVHFLRVGTVLSVNHHLIINQWRSGIGRVASRLKNDSHLHIINFKSENNWHEMSPSHLPPRTRGFTAFPVGNFLYPVIHTGEETDSELNWEEIRALQTNVLHKPVGVRIDLLVCRLQGTAAFPDRDEVYAFSKCFF